MNFADGYPETSIWQLTDIYHPYCAFNALGYDLVITNLYGNVLHSSSQNGASCCPFQSPSPDNPITHSSIWWDGYTDNIFGNPVHPSDGVYFYLVTLYGCDGATETMQGFIQTFGSSGLIQAPSDPSAQLSPEQEILLQEAEKAAGQREGLEQSIYIAPNPVADNLTIHGITANTTLQILDAAGKILSNHDFHGQTIDVSKLASGVYHLKILMDNTYLTKTFVKK